VIAVNQLLFIISPCIACKITLCQSLHQTLLTLNLLRNLRTARRVRMTTD